LSRLYEGWRAALIRNAAYVEAVIDFSEEDEKIQSEIIPQGIPGDVFIHISTFFEVRDSVKNMVDEIGAHLKDQRRGELMRAGASVAIIGPPNAGKSMQSISTSSCFFFFLYFSCFFFSSSVIMPQTTLLIAQAGTLINLLGEHFLSLFAS
jgi:hypothetical protein